MNIITKDEYNQDIILDNSKIHQIMMEWEKPYMKKCIQKLNPFGDVLEVGFGFGYSATEIQKYPINSYTLIECDEAIYQKALEWKEKKNYNHQINIIFDRWQNVCKYLPKFDCIFFDDYDTLTTQKNKSNNLCRNMVFATKICNSFKKYTRLSFFCADNEKTINDYKLEWEFLFKQYNCKFYFDEYLVDIPQNCKYMKNKKLYCPLVEIKNVFNYC